MFAVVASNAEATTQTNGLLVYHKLMPQFMKYEFTTTKKKKKNLPSNKVANK
jgi:hypothetical protein